MASISISNRQRRELVARATLAADTLEQIRGQINSTDSLNRPGEISHYIRNLNRLAELASQFQPTSKLMKDVNDEEGVTQAERYFEQLELATNNLINKADAGLLNTNRHLASQLEELGLKVKRIANAITFDSEEATSGSDIEDEFKSSGDESSS